jgi:hypothetical protein
VLWCGCLPVTLGPAAELPICLGRKIAARPDYRAGLPLSVRHFVSPAAVGVLPERQVGSSSVNSLPFFDGPKNRNPYDGG